MTIDQIRFFLAAAAYQNFSEAAEKVYISPSSFSRQISAMERELNLQLFVRTNRAVRLTPAGKLLQDRFSELYQNYQDSVNQAKQTQFVKSLELNVGILDGLVTSSQFPVLIQKMKELYPNILINLFSESFDALELDLLNGKADLAMTLEGSITCDKHLECLTLSKTKDYLVVHKDDPLSSCPKSDRMKVLQESTFVAIVPEETSPSETLVQSLRKKYGFHVKFAPNLETCMLWVQSGLGFAVLNSNNILAQNPNMCYMELEEFGFCPLSPDLVLYYRAENMNPALPAFLGICNDYLKVGLPPVPCNLKLG